MLGIGLDLSPAAVRAVRNAIAGGVPSLDLSFLGGVMPAGVTFTRAGAADYIDVNGAAQTAAVDQPRLTADGLMIYDAAGAGAAEIAIVSDMSWYNASAGTFLAEFSLPALSVGNMTVFSANAGSAVERHTVRVSNAGLVNSVSVTGNVTQQAASAGTLSPGAVQKVAFAYAVNDFVMVRNGVVGTTDAAGTLPTPTRLQLGAALAADYLNGYLRRLRFFPARLGNATLQGLTT